MGTIASMETDFQNQLELLFENMGNTTFKACRRALPIGMIPIHLRIFLSFMILFPFFLYFSPIQIR